MQVEGRLRQERSRMFRDEQLQGQGGMHHRSRAFVSPVRVRRCEMRLRVEVTRRLRAASPGPIGFRL
jgi:hypothetical protein